ncbi:proline--tRNA ligase [Streptomyces rapamycinicus]|uniref:Proline--tRNA ligase n=2 Tax=Streptomyces rapamycinicus TaxID=1226757 RepID=A0A0A0NCM5_STRRN|nr:proline--tRNA ligase [Streptomyces rapamycinicus]AGP54729.1 prolyl-tRNA synthetase [Streptomyces rapamycinicus NRRL 5491]MBB4782250.1 prolyl-tRNA synthetase [Streptomyces rapamycinicus]RLV82266.1 proline--tRNA ligase [Streptomyces rapamycinicus NRRL 5491]UTO62778.1 proline--tRNA ligase [Streptomyces rapamycinicus]UTP30736.1 proline--tRNA ligase [Streptomyces rapamycinicus NRRL 5491]
MAKAPVLTPQAEDFPRWYQDVINKAELADNGPVRGTMVIRPYGYGLWERMQQDMDARIKAVGVQNAYFPLFIPQSYLAKEADHVEGFAPELAVVTHGGGKELEEPVVVRPTSETIVNEYFSKWVQSYRDLPLLINQWANVVRWELRPRLFLRTTEFLWQEGHTAHASYEDARAFAARIHREVYARFMEDVLAMDVVLGRKTARERFAGALNTLTLEGMMGDGKALQLGTSHELGQNFARAFHTSYLSKDGEQELVWQTSWGSTTRMVGALVMMHGDDNGLRIPPRLAPVQVVVVAIKGDDAVLAKVREIGELLTAAGVRAHVDDRTDTAFGRRAVDWELKGVPVRVEVGPRDLESGTAMVVRRIPGGKEPVRAELLPELLPKVLEEDQALLLRQARERRKARTTDVTTMEEAAEVAAAGGWARIRWSDLGPEGEAALAERSVSVRCLVTEDGAVPDADDAPGNVAFVARAY